MPERMLLGPKPSRLLEELVELSEQMGTRRFFLESKGRWISVCETRLLKEGEVLLHEELANFEILRDQGFVAFELQVNALTRDPIDITSRAIEYYRDNLQEELPNKHLQKSRTTILFLASNPSDTTRIRVDREVSAVDRALRAGGSGDKFELEKHFALEVTELQEFLLRYKPDIVHFSGHGSMYSEIYLEDASGMSHPVSVRALSRLFAILKDDIKCVVLNTCYSERQAQAISQHIDCVIGMSNAIGDKAAIGFSTAFYRALAYGRDIRTSFELGCVQIDLEGLNEQDIPKLLALNCDSANTSFIETPQVLQQ